MTRKTQIDGWAEAHGAVYEPVGQWRRAWYFPKPGEDMDAAVGRECRAVRQSLGIFDASTLGKIEVVGPDAVEFMNRMYTNPWTKLAPGRCRYGLLLGDDGFIRDDGVIGRMTEDRFHVTTTTGGAARVLNMMEDYLQTEWPDLKAWLTSTTEQWSTIALTVRMRPSCFRRWWKAWSSRKRPSRICPARNARSPACRRGCSASASPARSALRSTCRHLSPQAVEILWEAGRQYDITPYGTETMHVLRAEKGYIIVGQDTDGTVTPYDAAMGWAVGKSKPDFVGKRGLARPDLTAKGRRHLVGLLTEDRSKLEEGAQIVFDPKQPIPMKMVGM